MTSSQNSWSRFSRRGHVLVTSWSPSFPRVLRGRSLWSLFFTGLRLLREKNKYIHTQQGARYSHRGMHYAVFKTYWLTIRKKVTSLTSLAKKHSVQAPSGSLPKSALSEIEFLKFLSSRILETGFFLLRSQRNRFPANHAKHRGRSDG